MFEKEIAHERSRLGELLINKGLITRQQLDQALQRQKESGQKLGEVLLALQWISDRQLNRALARQKSYRYAIAFAAAVSAPLTPLMAAAATADEPAAAVMSETRGGLRALDDDSMAGVSGQAGLNIQQSMSSVMTGTQQHTDINNQTNASTGNQIAMANTGSLNQMMATFKPSTSNNAVDMLINTVKSVLPLQADIQIKGVTYAATTSGQGSQNSKSSNSSSKSADPLQTLLPFQADGSGVSMEVAVPTHIDSILFSNIQPSGAASNSPTMGSVAMVGIDLHNTTVKVTMR